MAMNSSSHNCPRALDEISTEIEAFNTRSTLKRTFEHSKKDDKLVDSLRKKLDNALELFRVSLYLHTSDYSS
jgi:hypothetical protein